MLTPPALAVRLFRRIGRIKRFEYPAVMAEDGLEELLFLADAPSRQSGRQIFNGVRSVPDHFAFSSRFFGAHQLQAEICGLLDWAAEIAPRTVCEIGTAMGGTTYLLGQGLPSVTRLLGVDLFVRRKQRLRFFARPDQRLTFFDGSSYDPTTVARVARDLAGEKLDLLFIDGDHSLQGVAKDFAAYRGFVRDGGIIVFHDVVQDHTTRYGRRTPSYTGGVPQFWREIKPSYQTREFIESPEQDGFGIGALIYDSAVVPPKVI